MNKHFGMRIALWTIACAATFPFSGSTVRAETEREQLFSIPTLEELPLQIETLSTREEDGVRLIQFYFNGPSFNGEPTRILAFYAVPIGAGPWPGVVQLHGSGLKTLKPDPAIGYAKSGYACISIDWAGPDYRGNGESRKEPHSKFKSRGNMALKDAAGRWDAISPEEDARANGVRFIRRSLQFLRARPEVAADQLCISGMSAGAQATLVALAFEPDVKAAAVKYGGGFIRELNWGGVFGPITAANRDDPQDVNRWISIMDPKHGLADIRASTLMMSGTDDIFYWLPSVLATWRHIPARKSLFILPNDNHGHVNNEVVPRRWFDHILGRAGGAWPEPAKIATSTRGGQLQLAVTVAGEVESVSFWVKRMPLGKFRSGRAGKSAETVKWLEAPAGKGGNGEWTALVPAVADDEQLVAYGTAISPSGAKASSDTVELPEMDNWGKAIR